MSPSIPTVWTRKLSKKEAHPWRFLFPVLIECCQFVFGTGVSEEDLILNTVGAAMGYGLYCVGLRLRKWHHHSS
ncbi:MAG: VanZ family protein [Candidatus Limivicinus sp.]|nr:VanZ family protein [Candidatus Limivicinus sp.]